MRGPRYKGMKKPRLVERELKKDFGEGRVVFIGSSIDMFSDAIPSAWIDQVLLTCSIYNKNKYLFQSKQPRRFLEFFDSPTMSLAAARPSNVIFATTIESNFDHPEAYETGDVNTGQPTVDERFNGIMRVKQAGYDITVTIEPIMAFSLNKLREMIDDLMPEWISIGADSQKSGLPEPTGAEVRALMRELEKNHRVIIKSNLRRLTG
tara:strand:+ start:6338 stop:6958 length:621 start_codon:yes stop_codon:yes gene_type:complete